MAASWSLGSFADRVGRIRSFAFAGSALARPVRAAARNGALPGTAYHLMYIAVARWDSPFATNRLAAATKASAAAPCSGQRRPTVPSRPARWRSCPARSGGKGGFGLAEARGNETDGLRISTFPERLDQPDSPCCCSALLESGAQTCGGGRAGFFSKARRAHSLSSASWPLSKVVKAATDRSICSWR